MAIPEDYSFSLHQKHLIVGVGVSNIIQISKVMFYSSFKNNTSFVSRFNTLRRGRSTTTNNPVRLQAPTTSNDNINSGTGASGNGSSAPTDHQPLSREASIKKGSDGKQPYIAKPSTLPETCKSDKHFKRGKTLIFGSTFDSTFIWTMSN